MFLDLASGRVPGAMSLPTRVPLALPATGFLSPQRAAFRWNVNEAAPVPIALDIRAPPVCDSAVSTVACTALRAACAQRALSRRTHGSRCAGRPKEVPMSVHRSSAERPAFVAMEKGTLEGTLTV